MLFPRFATTRPFATPSANETLHDWPLERACDFATECGHEGLEIGSFTLGRLVTDVFPAQREEIGRTFARAGLACVVDGG